ncbi:MAG: carboxypeptidase regulatory-like domain-containing protein [Bryobacteraceae bacterium]
MRRIKATALLSLALFIPAALLAQADKGTLLGSVQDTSGAAVANADVKVTEVNTNIAHSAKTNGDGNYSFPLLDPGMYTVEAEHAGFKRSSRTNVILDANSALRTDFALQLGSVSESIDVSASAATLQTDRADLGEKIEMQTLENMPLGFNRNYQGLLGLTPGASRPFRTNSSFYNSGDHLSTFVNGQFRQASTYLIEGIINDWDNGNVTALVPPIEAIQTVDVTTTNYDAEFGRVTGAVTNVILRSGTNAWHGSAFEFNKARALSAKNFFALTTPPLVYNLFGGTFGGPIEKNKIFFFADTQILRDRETAATGTLTIPTPAFRSGDLGAAATTIYDPATGNPDGTGRKPFPGNVIPASRLSPIAQKILAYLPPPIRGGLSANYPYAVNQAKNTENFDVKIDHQINANNSVAWRYSYQQPEITVPPVFGIVGGPGNGGFAGAGTARSQAPGVSYTHIFGPALITELRFGISRVANNVNQTDYGTTTAKQLGIGGANIDPWSSGMSSVSISGFDSPLVGYSPSEPWRRTQTNFELTNSWTKIWGNHTVKWGADLNRDRNDLLQTQTFDPRGRFNYAGGQTSTPGAVNGSANAFAAFLLDLPNQVGRDLYVEFPTVRQSYYQFFGQDKWQASHKLTLDIGLRYEYWPAATSHYKRQFVNYDPSDNSLLVGGAGNIPKNLGIHGDPLGFAPRFGLSYRIDDKTVARAAFGISYLFRDTSQYNFPSNQVSELDALNSYTPAGSMATGFPAPILLTIPANGIILNAPLNLTYAVMPKDLVHERVNFWNVAVQRELPWSLTFEVAYVGNHGVDDPVLLQLNRGTILGAGAAGQPLNRAFGRRAGVTAPIGVSTHYNALQTKLNRRFSNGFLLTTSYTYSKSIDYCSDRLCTPFNQYNFAFDRAASDFNHTQVFVQSFLYELPLGSGKRWLRSGAAGWALGGWQVNGIFTAQTGAPIDIQYSAASLNTPFINNRPNVNGPVKIFGRVNAGGTWFDTSVFSAPVAGTFGNIGRNTGLGPNLVNLDFSLFRKFAIRERVALELRAETLNLTNTPHFNNPGNTFGTATFGVISSAVNDSRIIQFGGKISF